MSKRASPTAIGAFVVGGLALVVVGVLIFAGGRFFERPLRYALFFDTSIEGLTVGAPVQWRGVKVGQVSRIEARWGTPWIEVILDVDPRLLRRDISPKELEDNIFRAVRELGLRAQLRTQSFLTGQLFVAIDLFPESEIKLAGLDHTVPELPVVPTKLQVFGERIEKVLETLSELPLPQLIESTTRTVESINKVAASEDLRQTLHSGGAALEEFNKLARTLNGQAGPLLTSAKETVDSARGAVTDVSQDARKLLAQLDTDARTLNALLLDAQRLVQNTNGEIGAIGVSVRGTLEEARAVLARAQATLGAIDGTLESARATLGAVDGTLGGDTSLGYQLLTTLQDLAAASRSLRTLSDSLDQHPEALLKGKGSPGGK